MNIEILFLVLMRVTSFFIIVPIFGGKNVPVRIKIALAFYISIVVYYTLTANNINIQNIYINDYVFVIIKEIFVGWILGFIVYMIVNICYLSGQLIDFNIGFTMVNMYDPMTHIQVPITGSFYYFIFLAMMLLNNAHHVLFKALTYSYHIIPIGQAKMGSNLLYYIVDIFTNMFIVAFKIASPIVFTMFIINIALGILVKTAPQMNIFVVGIPIKFVIGLLALVLVSPVLFSVFNFIIEMISESIFMVMKGLSP